MPIMNTVIAGGGTTPTGTIPITINGIYDVTNYASADVNVSGGGSIPDYYVRKSIVNGTMTRDTTQTTMSVSPATDVGNSGLRGFAAFALVSSVDCSSITTVTGSEAFREAFYGGNYSVNFNNLATVTGDYAFRNAFMFFGNGNNNIVFPALTSVGIRAFSVAFVGISANTISFPVLTTAGNYAFAGAFNSASMEQPSDIQNLLFPALTTVGAHCFENAFVGCNISSIAFPAITSIGDYGFASMFSPETQTIESVTIGGTAAITLGQHCFEYMFGDCFNDIEVYAPAANQAEIEAMAGYPEFGGQGTITWNWQS